MKPLPPDPEGMNEDRAGWAQEAIDSLARNTGLDPESALTDLLADLMHWCDRQVGMDFNVALDMARMHYRAETGDET